MPVTTPLSPCDIELSTNPDSPDSHREQVLVRLPGSGVIPKIDVYFPTESTGSTGGTIGAVSAWGEGILNRLITAANAVVHFGVGNHKDLEDPHPDRLRGQLAGQYKIPSTLSGLYLQLDHPGWTGDGANVDQNTCTGPTCYENHNQHWRLERL
ncbi:RICIN domain-containing protein [Lentzea jiangxiensis]|uniref:Ricin-type beta-trefoil lectin domain-like n=1 Tax=Lentzea jiangxiensis TaxID=641025 RepID=A0A1H0VQK6_9PSEU|nr:RICIN domain-containing protein [Lentzea jiangxiensis]SDP80475.1 hypothetical protein SAMN05421507_11555 [Lentzea jiangxiensis]